MTSHPFSDDVLAVKSDDTRRVTIKHKHNFRLANLYNTMFSLSICGNTNELKQLWYKNNKFSNDLNPNISLHLYQSI